MVKWNVLAWTVLSLVYSCESPKRSNASSANAEQEKNMRTPHDTNEYQHTSHEINGHIPDRVFLLDTDSSFVYIKPISSEYYRIIWGNKRHNCFNTSSDTFHSKSPSFLDIISLNETSSRYAHLTYSAGTGAWIGVFLPYEDNAKEQIITCPIAVSLDRDLVAHLDFDWQDLNTLCVVSNLKSGKSIQIKEKRCDAIMPSSCMVDAKIIADKLKITWQVDRPDSGKTLTKEFRLNF